MSSPWGRESWSLIMLLVVGVIAGLLFQNIWFGIALALAYFIFKHVRQLRRLEQWLTSSKKEEMPDVSGIWGEIYYYFSRMYSRNQNRKRRLTNLLNRFQKSTAALPDATVVLDEHGSIAWWNDAAIKVFDFRSSDRGQRIENLIRFPTFISFINEGDYESPILIPSPINENLTLNVRIVPYGKDQRLLVARDITHLLNLEKMRQDFVANVSHELRTPLTVIKGYLDTLVDGDEAASPLGPALSVMHEQSERMQTIVEDLLLLSRLENEVQVSSKVATVVLADVLVTRILKDAERLSAGRHTFTVEVEEGVSISGVETWIYSAFSNLVFNAVRYTPDGGEIKVRWYQDSSGAHFSVKDTGIGFSQSHIPRLTERFYRVDIARSRDSGGTGLGLAIVNHVLQLHDANLHVESMPNKGSLFRCDFPVERVIKQKTSATA